MMSSASCPSSESVRTPSAASASWMSSICPLNSSGAAERVDLYSGYSAVRCSVARETSNATARWVGSSSVTRFATIDRKP